MLNQVAQGWNNLKTKATEQITLATTTHAFWETCTPKVLVSHLFFVLRLSVGCVCVVRCLLRDVDRVKVKEEMDNTSYHNT